MTVHTPDGIVQRTAADFVECTTRPRAKRHWSLRRSRHWDLAPLCDGVAAGYDQDYIDRMSDHEKHVTIADLPLCKQCDKSRTRRMEGRRS